MNLHIFYCSNKTNGSDTGIVQNCICKVTQRAAHLSRRIALFFSLCMGLRSD